MEPRAATFLTSSSWSCAIHMFWFLLNSLFLKHRYHMALPKCWSTVSSIHTTGLPHCSCKVLILAAIPIHVFVMKIMCLKVHWIHLHVFVVHEDDGGGMNPISLWKCMTSECPNRKPPDSIGQSMLSTLTFSCLTRLVLQLTSSEISDQMGQDSRPPWAALARVLSFSHVTCIPGPSFARSYWVLKNHMK
jgi:hypothetical protein